jgi:uncharacterized protein YceK
MKKHVLPIILGAMLLLSGCASVRFYSDAGLKHKSGLKVYSAKPFILCDYSSGKEKVSVIWLPDLLSPRYLNIRQGLGTNDLKIAIENGSLSAFGLSTDSNIPETFNALASIVSKGASAAEMLGASPVHGAPQSESVLFDLYELTVRNDSLILRKVNISTANLF